MTASINIDINSGNSIVMDMDNRTPNPVPTLTHAEALAILFDADAPEVSDADVVTAPTPTNVDDVRVVKDVTATKGDQVVRLQWKEGNVPVDPKASLVDFICLEEARAMAELSPRYRTYARLGSVLILPRPNTDNAYIYRIVSHDTHHEKPRIIQQRRGLDKVRRHMEGKGLCLLHIMALACRQRIEDQRIIDLCEYVFRDFTLPPPYRRLDIVIGYKDWKLPTDSQLRRHIMALLPGGDGPDAECHVTTEEDKRNTPLPSP
jgi:hypothetical protein